MHHRQFHNLGTTSLRSEYVNDYFEKMGREERIINITRNGKFHTFITYSICDDYKPYVDKDLWDYLPHDPNGKICFVEKLMSLHWTLRLRKKLERAIIKKYPQVEMAVWMRPGINNDRKVIYRRTNGTRI